MRATPVIIQSLPDSWNNSRESFETSEGKGRFIGEGKVACKIVCEQKGEIYLAEEERDIVSCYMSPWKVALRVQTWETRKTWAKAWARCAINGGMNRMHAKPILPSSKPLSSNERKSERTKSSILSSKEKIWSIYSAPVTFLWTGRERIASVARTLSSSIWLNVSMRHKVFQLAGNETILGGRNNRGWTLPENSNHEITVVPSKMAINGRSCIPWPKTEETRLNVARPNHFSPPPRPAENMKRGYIQTCLRFDSWEIRASTAFRALSITRRHRVTGKVSRKFVFSDFVRIPIWPARHLDIDPYPCSIHGFGRQKSYWRTKFSLFPRNCWRELDKWICGEERGVSDFGRWKWPKRSQQLRYISFLYKRMAGNIFFPAFVKNGNSR